MPAALLKPLLPKPQQQTTWGNVYGAALGLALAESMQTAAAPLLVVLNEQRQLQVLQTEIQFFLPTAADRAQVVEFPSWECLPYDWFSPHQDIISARLRLLAQLPQTRRGIILTTSANLLQRLPPHDYVLAHSFSLRSGQQIDLDQLRGQLSKANYVAVNQVLAAGEFAVRGGLLDVFPMGAAQPFRLDLLDAAIESIRYFDPETQRSSAHVDTIELLPAREFPMTEQGITTFRQAFRRQFEGDPRKQSVYNEVSAGRTPAGVEYFFPLFFAQTHTLFDYLNPNTIIVTECGLPDHIDLYSAEIETRYTNANYDPARRVLPPEDLYLAAPQLHAQLAAFSRIRLLAEADATADWSANSRRPQSLPVESRQDSPYQSLLNHLKQSQQRCLLVAETPGRREAMHGLLQAHAQEPTPVADFAQFIADQVELGLCVCELERGLCLPEHGVEVISESQLYGEKVFQRRRRTASTPTPENLIRSLAELSVGAAVVHIEHGVGRYAGLQTLTSLGEEAEFLVLEYQDQDKLYVPVLDLHLISRFAGDAAHAPLHRLGGDAWQREKKRAREKAYDIATELLEIHALRAARQGTAMQLPQPQYDAFVARFPFEETVDQQRAIDEVLADLQSREPMDRLVCGDVGFGKTEVALRAAFVAVHNDTQVAMLVPTTLLAQQHYQNFVDRFADLSIRIELLSRLKSKKHNTDIIAAIKHGQVDIVIATHKLLQDELGFANLGLLMIDEEHRFGVRQKEKLKRLRSQVDILTLTATPIPRTLNISLAGLRTISFIATPPQSRLSIKTFVRETNQGLIREACLREIRRGGQVYFLHNDVRSIERNVFDLRELVPEAEINFAHGQMRESQLERVMQDFYHQRFNILVCTTIIESGIDIPSANTIIINRADRFGLAQLHQLRGRVGRSHHQAYAYLLVIERRSLTNDAKKRLDAIESMEDLGAGFALASQDLEIRGAGELLGETQSGSIDSVGFALYNEYLSQAVKSIQHNKMPGLGAPLPAEQNVQVNLHLTARLPANYLANAHTRLILYKRIASAADDAELDELQIELIDRFGLLPEAAKNLFRVTSIRLHAQRLGISKIDIGESGGQITLAEQHHINPARIIQLAQQAPHEYRLRTDNSFSVRGELEQPEARLARVDGLLEELDG